MKIINLTESDIAYEARCTSLNVIMFHFCKQGVKRKNHGRRQGNKIRIGRSKIKEMQWGERRKSMIQN
jgi:hypothetical protein